MLETHYHHIITLPYVIPPSTLLSINISCLFPCIFVQYAASCVCECAMAAETAAVPSILYERIARGKIFQLTVGKDRCK